MIYELLLTVSECVDNMLFVPYIIKIVVKISWIVESIDKPNFTDYTLSTSMKEIVVYCLNHFNVKISSTCSLTSASQLFVDLLLIWLVEFRGCCHWLEQFQSYFRGRDQPSFIDNSNQFYVNHEKVCSSTKFSKNKAAKRK